MNNLIYLSVLISSLFLGYGLYIQDEFMVYSSYFFLAISMMSSFTMKANFTMLYLLFLILVAIYGLYSQYKIIDLLYYDFFVLTLIISYCFKFEKKGIINVLFSIIYCTFIYSFYIENVLMTYFLLSFLSVILFSMIFVDKFIVSNIILVAIFSAILFFMGIYKEEIYITYFATISATFYGALSFFKVTQE